MMTATDLQAESAFANCKNDALLLDALRRWKAAVIAYRTDPRCGDEPAWEALLQAADDIAAEAAAIPADGIEGLAVKLFLSIEHDIGLTGDDGFAFAWDMAGDRFARIGEPTVADALRLAPTVAAILEL